MIKEIKYNGYSANPSDDKCEDGDLAMSLGLVPEYGSLKPVLPPKCVLHLDPGYKVVYIHETSSFRHYIISHNNALGWWAGTGGDVAATSISTLRDFGSQEIYQVNAVGNTLVVLTSDGIHYFLWKDEGNGYYVHLGTHFPECGISFGLQGKMERTDMFQIWLAADNDGDGWGIPHDNLSISFPDDVARRVADQITAHINTFIAEKSVNQGKFIFPFFVRYAYRLYDGSLVMHSSPVLMITASEAVPKVFWSPPDDDMNERADVRIVGMVHELDYAAESQAEINSLKNWKDIIQSVDIFISKPIYTYDQNGTEYTNFYLQTARHLCYSFNRTEDSSFYTYRNFYRMHEDLLTSDNFTGEKYWLKIPERAPEDVKKDICSTSQFYLLASVKIDDLRTSRQKLTVPEDYLQSLLTREVMTDDYDSHDQLIPRYSFVYNARLNVANIEKELYHNYHASSLITYNNDTETADVTVYFYIRQDGRDIIVDGDSALMMAPPADDRSGFSPPFLYLFYPNTNAYKAVIISSCNDVVKKWELPLEKHSFLSGAFYFRGWNFPLDQAPTVLPAASAPAQRTVKMPNKLYTSEINNPFFFPLLGINTIGTGKILGISAAVKALSEGQFGQFPLYAFTTEGIWALEVSATGTYSAKQPVSRDVCINGKSITQIDSAVLFVTNRGIMLISGSNVQCLSEILNAPEPFHIMDLPCAAALRNIYNDDAATDEQIAPFYSRNQGGQVSGYRIAMLPFFTFLSTCRIVYDYANQHIIVYNPAVGYAYVFSFKSQKWGMMWSKIADNVDSYPEALAMTTDDRLVDFSSSTATDVMTLLVTRPFTMEEPNTFKTIDTVIQRGVVERGHVKQVLIGSNDLINWYDVWSSTDIYLRGFKGSPYKYFRIALIGSLSKSESLTGFTVQYESRLLNRPR